MNRHDCTIIEAKSANQLQSSFHSEIRIANRNTILKAKIKQIVESYYRNSEASPKKDDNVKHMSLNELVMKQKWFALCTGKENHYVIKENDFCTA